MLFQSDVQLYIKNLIAFKRATVNRFVPREMFWSFYNFFKYII